MTQVEVVKTFRFEAAHVLPWHPGKCARLHGHSYRLDVHITGTLDENGVVTEFGHLSERVRELVIDRCDHRLLNDLIDNPTVERLALQCLQWLEPLAQPPSCVVLWETETSRAVVRP